MRSYQELVFLRRSATRLATLLFLTAGGAWSGSAWAHLAVTVEKMTDGTGTCTLDTDASNGVLCTNDAARYRVQYQVSPDGQTGLPVTQDNVVLTISLPAGEPFRFLPSSGGLASCVNAATALSSDGRTVTCQLSSAPIPNVAAAIPFDVVTDREAKNGDVLTGVSATLSSNETPAVNSSAPGVTVVARPQIDLKKTFNSTLSAQNKPANCSSSAAANAPGYAVQYRVVLNIPQIQGHESLAPGWSYTDDLTGMGPDACVYSVQSHRQLNPNSTLPPGGVAANVPVDAGTGEYTYTQTGSSVTVTASTTNQPLTSGETVTPMDGMTNATAVHYIRVWVPAATASANGCFYTPQNYIEPLAAAGLSGALNTGDDPANNRATHAGINVCSGSFEKLYFGTSKSRSAPLINTPNRMSNELIGPNDYVDSYVYWVNTGLASATASMCDHWDNRKMRLDSFDPNQFGPWDSPTWIGSGSPYRWKTLPASGQPARVPGYAHIYTSSVGATSAIPNATPEQQEIQFGFVDVGAGDELLMRSKSCGDGDSTLSAVAAAAGVDTTGILASGWITQSALEANPALVPYINSMRLTHVQVPAGGRIQVFTHLTTLPADPDTGVTWADGTILPNYGVYQASTEAGFEPGNANWKQTARSFMGNDPNAVVNVSSLCASNDPARYCDDNYSDRLRLSTQSVGIRKGIAPGDPSGGPVSDSPAVAKTKGQTVDYQLWPSLVANQPNVTIPNDLILIDTIPAGMKFVPGSLTWGGVDVPASDYYLDDQSASFGASTLMIRLPNVNAVSPANSIAAVEFQAEILLDAPSNTPNALKVNQVEIKGCAPGASVTGGVLTCVDQTAAQRLVERQAKRTVQLGSVDGLIVRKSVDEPSKEVGSTFTMALRYLNVGNEEVAEHRLIDVLPYNGEPNRGGTSFSGTRPVLEVRAPAATGYQVFYTTDPQGTINTDPKCSSNITGVVGNWPAYAPGVPSTTCSNNATGTTNWTLATQAGASWTVPADTTALLMKDTVPFPSGAVSRVFELDFNTPGSHHGDVYANNFSAAHGSAGTAAQSGAGAAYSTTSNNVVVDVYASSIRGTVFVDPNGDGATTGFDPANDTGLGGVTVTLQQAGATVATAVTATADIPAGQYYNPADGSASATAGAGLCLVPTGGLAAGQYLFCNLVAGDYTVVQTQPANYETTGNKAGTAGGTVSGDTISAITLPLNNGSNPTANATGYDFGERAVVAPAMAVVDGRVYVEGNGNTSDDGNATDPGLPGVTVTLTYTPAGGGADVTLTTTTGADGSYSFSVPVGATNVRLVQTQPSGYTDAYQTPGSNGAADGGTNAITIGTITPAGSTGNNFAEVTPPAGTAVVDGRVYVEGNGNTSDDGNATDPGLSGVTVTLTYTPAGGGADVTLTTTTGADGSYSFSVPVGATNVRLVQTQPSGYTDAYQTPGSNGAADGGTNAITIGTITPAGSTGNNFAEVTPAVATAPISGRVYVESNGNTVDNGHAVDPGIANVQITIRYTPPGGGAAVEISVLTDATGNYSVQVPIGATNITITETQPAGHGNAYESPGGQATSPSANVITIAGPLGAAGSTGNGFAEQPRVVAPGTTTPVPGLGTWGVALLVMLMLMQHAWLGRRKRSSKVGQIH